MRIYRGKEAWSYVAHLENRDVELNLFKEAVQPILDAVKYRGDEAVREYTSKLYGVDLSYEEFAVSKEEYEEVMAQVSDEALEVIEETVNQVRKFHELQKQKNLTISGDGISCKLMWVPLDRIGVHIPEFDEVAYISTMIFHVIPAKVAGVNEIVVFTPPLTGGRVNPLLLATAKVLNVDKIYRIGGPVAVAAMAYGTATISSVDKIFGTGDRYFMTAKKVVAQDANVDMPSGPSELLVFADSSTSPKKVVSEMISQAEHGPEILEILVTDSLELAEEVSSEIEGMKSDKMAASFLEENCIALVFNELEDAISAINIISPERVSVMGKSAVQLANKIMNAGAVFVGDRTPSALGDYLPFMNQQLPSGGCARRYGALTVAEFLRPVYSVMVSGDVGANLKELMRKLALLEGFPEHAASIDMI